MKTGTLKSVVVAVLLSLGVTSNTWAGAGRFCEGSKLSEAVLTIVEYMNQKGREILANKVSWHQIDQERAKKLEKLASAFNRFVISNRYTLLKTGFTEHGQACVTELEGAINSTMNLEIEAGIPLVDRYGMEKWLYSQAEPSLALDDAKVVFGSWVKTVQKENGRLDYVVRMEDTLTLIGAI